MGASSRVKSWFHEKQCPGRQKHLGFALPELMQFHPGIYAFRLKASFV